MFKFERLPQIERPSEKKREFFSELASLEIAKIEKLPSIEVHKRKEAFGKEIFKEKLKEAWIFYEKEGFSSLKKFEDLIKRLPFAGEILALGEVKSLENYFLFKKLVLPRDLIYIRGKELIGIDFERNKKIELKGDIEKLKENFDIVAQVIAGFGSTVSPTQRFENYVREILGRNPNLEIHSHPIVFKKQSTPEIPKQTISGGDYTSALKKLYEMIGISVRKKTLSGEKVETYFYPIYYLTGKSIEEIKKISSSPEKLYEFISTHFPSEMDMIKINKKRKTFSREKDIKKILSQISES